LRVGELVFPSPQSKRPVPNQTLWLTIKQATNREATTHGRRASLRSWMGDHGVEFEVAEAMLGHAPRSQTVQAYHRTTMTERRRPVAQNWADFLDGREAAKVAPFGTVKRGRR
jgi:site-specific recombinase XerD